FRSIIGPGRKYGGFLFRRQLFNQPKQAPIMIIRVLNVIIPDVMLIGPRTGKKAVIVNRCDGGALRIASLFSSNKGFRKPTGMAYRINSWCFYLQNHIGRNTIYNNKYYLRGLSRCFFRSMITTEYC